MADKIPTGNAEQLRQYWLNGEGAIKIRWGTPGQFDRCVRETRKHLGVGAEGYCATLYHRKNGQWPGRNK